MNQNGKDLLKHAVYDTSGKWVRADNIESLIEESLLACLNLVRQTPTKCAYTTYDLGVAECTIKLASEQILKHFDLKEKLPHETTMG